MSANPQPDQPMSEAEADRLLDVPFTFDLLRDPDWQPSREFFAKYRDRARAEYDALIEAADNAMAAIRVCDFGGAHAILFEASKVRERERSLANDETEVPQ